MRNILNSKYLLSLLLVSPSLTWSEPYREILPPAGHEGSTAVYAISINSSGVVTGSFLSPIDNKLHILKWENGVSTDLGVGVGKVITDSGAIGGTCTLSEYFADKPCIFSDNTISVLPGSGTVNDINSDGAAVGRTGDVFKAFKTDGSGFKEFSPPDGVSQNSNLAAINDNGIAIGEAFRQISNGMDTHLMKVVNNQASYIDGPAGGSLFSAADINNSNVIVGSFVRDSDNKSIGFYIKNDIFYYLEDNGEQPNPTSINDNGVIVGSLHPEVNGAYATYRAVIWKNNKLIDINRLSLPTNGWTLVSASKINNNGDIIGTRLLDSKVGAFVVSYGEELKADFQCSITKMSGKCDRKGICTLQMIAKVENAGGTDAEVLDIVAGLGDKKGAKLSLKSNTELAFVRAGNSLTAKYTIKGPVAQFKKQKNAVLSIDPKNSFDELNEKNNLCLKPYDVSKFSRK